MSNGEMGLGLTNELRRLPRIEKVLMILRMKHLTNKDTKSFFSSQIYIIVFDVNKVIIETVLKCPDSYIYMDRF